MSQVNRKLVEIKDNHVVVSTVQIAEKFEKRHCDVLRLADAKLRSANGDRLSRHFFKFSYKDDSRKFRSDELMLVQVRTILCVSGYYKKFSGRKFSH